MKKEPPVRAVLPSVRNRGLLLFVLAATKGAAQGGEPFGGVLGEAFVFARGDEPSLEIAERGHRCGAGHRRLENLVLLGARCRPGSACR